MKIKMLIKRLNSALKEDFSDFKGTYFFGSRSRKRNNNDADYDLLFAFGHKPDWKEKNRIYDLIADVEIEERIVIDAKAYSEQELKAVWTPFREQVLKEGLFFEAA